MSLVPLDEIEHLPAWPLSFEPARLTAR